MLTPEELRSLMGFVGYGQLDAPLWFLGMEESLGPRLGFRDWSPEAELRIRASWNPVIDVREAHQQLGDHYWTRRNYSQVWRTIAELARGFLFGAADWGDPRRAHLYVVSSLGRENGHTLLGELMPLPAAGLSHWPYAGLYPDRSAYWSSVWPLRKDTWRTLLSEHSPKIVVAYGKRYWKPYQELLGWDSWTTLVPGRIETKVVDGRAFVLTPFLGQGAVSKSDLALLVRWVRGGGKV